MSDEHKFFDGYDGVHYSAPNSTSGGKCLTGHETPYKYNSCSYRWQGLVQARAHKSIYNRPDIDKSCHIGGKTQWDSQVIKYLKKLDQAGPNGEKSVWKTSVKSGLITNRVDLTDPITFTPPDTKRYKEIEEVRRANLTFLNFTRADIPYANQVHHVLPNSALKRAISSLKGIEDVVAKDLMEAKYNINYKINMLILPSADKPSMALGLPKHLGDHPGYTGRIQGEVNRAFKPYQQMMDKVKDKKHPKVTSKNVKKKLESISESWYNAITSSAASNVGVLRSINDFVKPTGGLSK